MTSLYRGARMGYFNPRTREGCDVYQILSDTDTGRISIHAPVKGATHLIELAADVIAVFQSTHP